MSDFSLNFLGWNQDNGSDKVWGFASIGGRYYAFWGKRDPSNIGKSLRFKEHASFSNADDLRYQKMNKGYRRVKDSDIDTVYPGLIDHLKDQLMTAKLTNNIM